MILGTFNLHILNRFSIQKRISSFKLYMSTQAKPIELSIINKLQSLNPFHYEVINESYKHSSSNKHMESHFKIIIVSKEFEGMDHLKDKLLICID